MAWNWTKLQTTSVADEVTFVAQADDDPEFVQNVKEKGHKRVFWELKKYNNKYGHKVTDWFGRYKKKVGIKAPPRKKVYHSLRHNVTDHLFKQLVMESLIEEFAGRAGKTETRKRYAKGYRVETLYEEVVLKLDYEIDLSHLKNSKYVIT